MRNCKNCGQELAITTLYSSINKTQLTCPHCNTQFYKVRNRKFAIFIMVGIPIAILFLFLLWQSGVEAPGLVSTALLLFPVFLTADIICVDYRQTKSRLEIAGDLDKEFIESNNTKLEKLICRVITLEKDCVAICQVIGSFQGYTVVREIQQTSSGCFYYGAKSPLGADIFNKRINLDLLLELANLRREYPELPLVFPYDSTRHRYQTFLIATRDSGGEWFVHQSPRTNDYPETVPGRILKALATRRPHPASQE